MAKTAEEILHEHMSGKDIDELPNAGVSALREFAAQEVEEYKARLKRLIEDQHYSNSSMAELSFPQIIGLIDTVK